MTTRCRCNQASDGDRANKEIDAIIPFFCIDPEEFKAGLVPHRRADRCHPDGAGITFSSELNGWISLGPSATRHRPFG